jgi:hypothetical protein
MATTSSTKDYKKMCVALKTKNKDLQAKLDKADEDGKAWRKSVKDKMDTLKKETDLEKKTLADDLKKSQEALEEQQKMTQEVKDQQKEADTFIRAVCELTGKSSPDEVFQWMETAKHGEEAIRMFGELQVKYNLLQEQLDRIKTEGYTPAKPTKNLKGHSGTHRKEKVSQGVLECFHENRCCAMVWADGLGQQCSRHWDKHENGKESKLCKTHYKHYNPEDHCYSGAHGLYHINRPKKWGEHGLSVQTGTYKVGGNICWKMKDPEYQAQFQSAEFQSSIPTDLPQFIYPETQFHEDDDCDSEISAISGSTQAFSEGAGDVANLEDVEEVPAEEEKVEEVPVLEPQNTQELLETLEVEENPVEFAKQAQLDRLEKMNQGAIAVDYDILCDLRAEKKEWEEAQQAEEQVEELATDDSNYEISSDNATSDEEKMIECFQCDKQIKEGSGCFPCEPDEEYCFECARQIEYDQQNKCMAQQLPDSDDEDQ